MDPPTSGRRRAALRVKQKRRSDQYQWSPSGKLLRRPSSQLGAASVSHQRLWNDRFIFDEESSAGKARCSNGSRLSTRLGRRQRSAHGKENSAHEFMPTCVEETIAEGKRGAATAQENSLCCRSTIRHYTERADGEIVSELTRCEISPSSTVENNGKSSYLNGTRSIGVSPFDMAKVSAALDADPIIDGHLVEAEGRSQLPLHELNRSNTNGTKGAPNENRNSTQTQRNHYLWSLDTKDLIPVLDKFEEVLYTIELEEEVLKREIAQKYTEQHIPELFGSNEEQTFGSVVNDSYVTHFDQHNQAKMAEPRIREISQYVHKYKRFRDYEERCLSKNEYLRCHEIIEILAESIFDSCFRDVAVEIEQGIGSFSQVIFEEL